MGVPCPLEVGFGEGSEEIAFLYTYNIFTYNSDYI